MTRAQRNNNPGNIDRTEIKWQGMAADQSTDPRFIVFVSAAYGFRCMARIIHGHLRQDDTIRTIISRWAPPGENNTESYIECVARHVGVNADSSIDWTTQSVALLRAIAIHENDEGSPCLWPDSDIVDGIHLELIS